MDETDKVLEEIKDQLVTFIESTYKQFGERAAKVEYNVPGVEMVIPIGRNHVAYLSMDKEAFEELYK